MNGMPIWLKRKIAGQYARRHRLQAALERGGLSREAAELRAEQITAAHVLNGGILTKRGGEPRLLGEMLPAPEVQRDRPPSGPDGVVL